MESSQVHCSPMCYKVPRLGPLLEISASKGSSVVPVHGKPAGIVTERVDVVGRIMFAFQLFTLACNVLMLTVDM